MITLDFVQDYMKYNMGLVNDQKSNLYCTPDIDPKSFKLSENFIRFQNVIKGF